MELKVFPAPAVAGILNEMVEARLHLDKPDSAALSTLQEQMTNTLARPTYVIENPATGEYVVRALDLAWIFDAKLFADVLRDASREVRVAGSPRTEKVASIETE